MRTQNLAVMFTDIQGFTERTHRQTRDENARLLAAHDALLLPVVKGFGGRKVKSIGDAWLVVFDSPTNSLLCGMAVQDRLWDYNRRLPEGDRIRVRIAVNLGEVRVARSLSGTDVYGDPVNVASRVEGEAEVGEVWFTEAVYLAMNRAEVPVEEVGRRTLKGVAEPVRLYRAARGRYTLTAAPGLPGLPQPPYGNQALARVKGLAAPDPALIARDAAPAVDLAEAAGRVGRALADAPSRTRWLGLAAALAVAAVGTAIFWPDSRAERLLAEGQIEQAEAEIAGLAKARGERDAEVAYLRARLAQERLRRGDGGSAREVLERYGKALAAGSAKAAAELERQATSKDCQLRRLAAKALGDSRSRRALPALRGLATAEPEAPRDPVARVTQFLQGESRCGDGDLARDAIAEIESTP